MSLIRRGRSQDILGNLLVSQTIVHLPSRIILPAIIAAQSIFALAVPALADEEPEKRVTFYPSYGYLSESAWVIPLKVWVHEAPDFIRTLAAKAIRDELAERAHLDSLDQSEQDLFMRRADGFIADSESGEQIDIRFDADPDAVVYRLNSADEDDETDRNGLLESELTLSRARGEALLMAQGSADGWLTFRAVSRDQGGIGRIRLISPEGLSIVSDIDDTVKVTDILAGESEVLKNTFFREFRAAPCMARMYQGLGGDSAFHYVSGGPWQLYAPLAEFLFDSEAGFPRGTMHMKDVRTNPFESESYRDIWRLIAGGSHSVTVQQKIRQISTLLDHFPARRFILIGDSGERDPEIFAEIRARFPGRIDEIRIRDVAGAAKANPQRLEGMVVIPPSDPSGQCAAMPGQ